MPILAFTGEDDSWGVTAINENMVNEINKHGGYAKHTIFPVGHNCKRKAIKTMLKNNNWPFNLDNK